MIKKISKFVISISIIFVGSLLLATSVQANGLVEIIFEQKPLFQESNFLPGEEITHWIDIKNKSEAGQPIGIEVIDYSSCSENCLSDQLRLVIRDDNSPSLYSGSLTEFFEVGEQELSTLEPGEIIRYYFSVAFVGSSGNEYQNSSVNFDFKIGALGTESISGEVSSGGSGGGGGYLIPGLEIYNEVAGPKGTSVIISWLTNKNATSRVIYSSEHEAHTLQLDSPPKYGYKNTTPEYNTAPKVTGHSVPITGLDPGTTYYYRTISRASPPTISREHSFTTKKAEVENELDKKVKVLGEEYEEQQDTGLSTNGGEEGTAVDGQSDGRNGTAPRGGRQDSTTILDPTAEEGFDSEEEDITGEEDPEDTFDEEDKDLETDNAAQEDQAGAESDRSDDSASSNSWFWLILILIAIIIYWLFNKDKDKNKQ
jgi:hypothetical protein